MIRVKICGITNEADASLAWKAGADAIGMIFAAESPRRVDALMARRIAAAVPPFVLKVGVFVDPDVREVLDIVRGVGLQAVQLHGNESADLAEHFTPNCIKVLRPRSADDLRVMERYPAGAWLLDTWSPHAHGGTGQTFDWTLARKAVATGHPIILSGGLDPDNVEEAVRTVRPVMVDASSGLEAAVGHKDPAKVRAFVLRAKRAAFGSDDAANV